MDVPEFLAQPLVARLAVTGKDGHPTVRPVWFLFEDKTFWWLTGSSYSRLQDLLAIDPRVALVVDSDGPAAEDESAPVGDESASVGDQSAAVDGDSAPVDRDSADDDAQS